jgi:predicted component of type VI protein secretion system
MNNGEVAGFPRPMLNIAIHHITIHDRATLNIATQNFTARLFTSKIKISFRILG